MLSYVLRSVLLFVLILYHPTHTTLLVDDPYRIVCSVNDSLPFLHILCYISGSMLGTFNCHFCTDEVVNETGLDPKWRAA